MKQINLFTDKPEKTYEFLVEFYVPGQGNRRTSVKITRNDKRVAIWTAKNLLRIGYYQQAKAFRLNKNG